MGAKSVSLVILSERMRYMLSPGFEDHIETMFKLLNDQAIQSRLR
jgi:hypothetical protein